MPIPFLDEGLMIDCEDMPEKCEKNLGADLDIIEKD
jgi:hypothetical protein